MTRRHGRSTLFPYTTLFRSLKCSCASIVRRSSMSATSGRSRRQRPATTCSHWTTAFASNPAARTAKSSRGGYRIARSSSDWPSAGLDLRSEPKGVSGLVAKDHEIALYDGLHCLDHLLLRAIFGMRPHHRCCRVHLLHLARGDLRLMFNALSATADPPELFGFCDAF